MESLRNEVLGAVKLIAEKVLRKPVPSLTVLFGFLKLKHKDMQLQEDSFYRTLNLKGKVVYDVGAHIGRNTMVFRGLVGSSGQVLAFEPNPESFQLLCSNLQDTKNIRLFNIGLGEISSRCVLVASAYSNARGTINQALASKLKVGLHKTWIVPIEPLDECIEKNRLPLPDLVKVDTEGAELQVLKGMRKLLLEHHPRLFIEIHGISREDALSNFMLIRLCLSQLGYKFKVAETQHLYAYYSP